MFDMRLNSGGNAGYKLVINYNKDSNKYFLTGYVLFKDEYNKITADADGASLEFKSLEETLNHIARYPESLKEVKT